MNRLPQPPRWRIECPTRPAWSWSVRSPRGTVVFQTRDRRAAIHIGRSMAAIDELLARVNRPANVVPMARTGW